MRREIVWAILPLSLWACGREAVPQHDGPAAVQRTESRPAKQSDLSSEARLSSLASEFERFKAPRGGESDLPSGKVPQSLTQWKQEAKQRLSELEAQAVNLLEAEESKSGGLALRVIAEGNLFFAEEALRALESLSPRVVSLTLREKATLGRSELADALPQFQRSHAAAQLCLQWAERYAREGELPAACRETLARARLGVSYGKEPRVQSLLPEFKASSVGCEFVGEASGLQAVLYQQGRAVARVSAVRIERLSFVSSPERALLLESSRPFVGKFFLSPASRILRLGKMQPLFAGHLWLPAGALVSLRREGQGIQLTPEWPGREPNVDQLRLPCESLTLDSTLAREFAPSPTAWRMTKVEMLYEEPEGSELTLVGGAMAGVEVEERRGDWILLRSEENPFLMFRGWMHKPLLVAPEGEVRMNQERESVATHQMRPTLVATSDGQLLRVASGTPAKKIWAYADVALVAFHGASSVDGTGFWAPSKELRLVESP